MDITKIKIKGESSTIYFFFFWLLNFNSMNRINNKVIERNETYFIINRNIEMITPKYFLQTHQNFNKETRTEQY